jgi:hypothetical protein
VTPSGIEAGRNVTGTRRRTGVSTESVAGEWPAAPSECNECNEALGAAWDAIAAARRLALVADNAMLNGDLQRARAALHELHDATADGVTGVRRSRGTVSRSRKVRLP